MAGQVISRLTSSGGDDAGVHVISSSFYGTCSSAANAENKVVIIQNRNVGQVNLTKGMLLTVKFTNRNNYPEDGTSLPALQLFKNEATPDSIPIKGSALTTPMTIFAQQNSNIKPNWSAGSVVTFIYDTYIKQNQDGTTSTLGCWIKTAGLSEEIFDNLNIRIDNVESASTIAISGVTDRVNSIESNITQAAVVGDIEFIYWPIDSTTTPPVTPAASYDWEETFNVNCEWSTDALPYVFGLDIWQRTKSFTIGNASNPTYSDPIRITGRDGAKGDKGDQGDPGATGSPAYSYDLITDVTSLIRNVNTSPVVNNPSTITFSATKTEGNNVPTPYLEGKLTVSEYIYDTNESKWKWNVLENKTSFSVSNQSITVTPSIAATSVMGILFASDGTTELDKQTIPIIETGRNGSSVTVDSIQYGTSETEAATPQSWNASIPTTITPGWWLWTKTSYVGVATPAISKSYIGTDGEDGTSVTIQSISKDEGTTTVILNNGDGTTAALIIEDGTDGENGQQGPAGYIHTAWANGIGQTARDFIDFSRTNENNLTYLYMGVYTDNEEEDSNDPLDYSWTLIKGEDGNDAIVAYLTNESGSFAATSSAAVTASVSSQFVINKGGQTLTATIKNITPDPISSLPAYNAGALTVTSANDTFTIGINPNFTTTAYQHNGSFEITASATVNGISQDFTKDFSWVLVPAGVDGTNGTNGFNFANIRLYQIANQPPEKPRNDLIYTFNNQTLTPTSDLNGWSIDMPDMTSVTPGLSCYLISANAASLESTDVIKGIGINESEEDQSDWYGPIVYVQNGKDGLDAYNRASISLYQRSLTEPTEPTEPINYTFSTGILTPSASLGNWTTGVTAATDGEPCWVITANAISKNETYTITDWSNPAIFTQDGADGEGISIINREILYIESTSGTDIPNPNPSDTKQWSTIIPSIAEGNYLWTKTSVTYSDGNTLTSYSVAKQGESITVTSSSIQYATNNSTTTPTSGWQSSPPTTTPGWYIWTKTTTNYSDKSSVVSYSVSKTGTNGSNAYLYELHCDPSVITIDQNVQTPAFSPAAISLSATRTEGNNSPESYRGYFKLEYTNDNQTWTSIYTSTQAESALNCSITSQYIPTPMNVIQLRASLYKTSNMTVTPIDFEDIPVIRGGKNGINGYNQSTVYLYKRSDIQPTAPSNNHTYNFANKTFTDATSDKIENWTINKMPAADGDKVAWMTFAVASSTTSTDEIVSTEWSTPVKIEGVDGTDGYNQTVVQLYQRYNPQNENDTPTKPANNSLTYTFSTNKLIGDGLGNWSQQIPTPNGSPCWITVGVARSQSNSDVIDSWSDPTIYNKDGADGYNKATVYLYQRATSAPNRPSEELIYTFNNQTLTPTPGSTSGNNFLNNWSQTIPSDSTNPLWMIAAVANNTAVSDSILATEWSAPTKMEGVDGQPGQPGQPGTNGYNQATIDLYKRTDSAPTSSSMPGTLTYTFGATNPLSNPANGWSQIIPTANGQPCWVTSGVAISRDTSATISSWSTPTKILEDSVFVNLDNDNITLPTENGIAKPTTITINVSAYKGISQINTSINNDNITGKISGKISTSVNNNNSKTTQVVVTITNQLTTDNEKGILTIPVTAAGVTINKQFTWSLFENGLNQATLYLYKRAATASKPTSNYATYNFGSKTLSIPPAWGTGENNLGWQTTFPQGDQGDTTPVWVITAVASSNTNTDTIDHSEWSNPVEWISNGKDGEDAYNQADVFLYRRATTAITPVFVNNSITYTFSTGINGLNSSYNTNTSPAITWYTSVTAATNSQNDYMPCWMSSVHPVSQNASVDISNNWSAPTIYIQPGIGIKNIVEYYVATSSTDVTINNTDWVIPDEGANPPIHMPQIDSTNKYLWNYEVTTYTDNTSRTINPHIVATYGNAGKGISSIVNYYQTTSTSTTPSNIYQSTTTPNGWSICPPSDVPTVSAQNKFLWNYEEINYTEGDPTFTKIHLVGVYGDKGKGVVSIIEQAILWEHDDSDLETYPAPANTRDDWQPRESVVWESEKYIWVRTIITWTEGDPTYIGPELAKNDNNLNEKIDNALSMGTEYIVGTQTASTNAWTGNTQDSALYIGKSIAYKLPYAGTSTAATLNLTLSNGTTTGAKAIKMSNSTSSNNASLQNITTQYPANSIIHLVYDGTQWISSNYNSNVDTNTWDREAYKASVTAIEAIAAGKIGVFKIDTNDNNKAKLQTLSSEPFDLSFPILYIGTAYTATALTQTNNYTFWGTPFNLTSTHAIQGATANRPVYIVGTISGNIMTPTENVLTCTEPTEENELYYIRLGFMSTSANAILESQHSIYAFVNGKFQQVAKSMQDQLALSEKYIQSQIDTIDSTLESTLINTTQLWFITDYHTDNLLPPSTGDTDWDNEHPFQPVNQSTGNYDNWVLSADPYIEINPNNPPNRYEVTSVGTSEKPDYTIKDKIIKNSNNENRDVTEYCIITKNENNSTIIQKYYPYHYYCYRFTYSNGDIRYSDVIYDAAKTLISQSKIISEKQNTAIVEALNLKNQYFFHDNSGTHVTDNTSYTTDWNTNGLFFRTGTVPFNEYNDKFLLALLPPKDETTLDQSGLVIYDTKGNTDENVIARFSPEQIQLGAIKDDAYIIITPQQMQFYKNNIPVAFVANNKFYTPNITIDSTLTLKTNENLVPTNKNYEWGWIPRENGNVAFKWIGTI